jgi:hypothetical protein
MRGTRPPVLLVRRATDHAHEWIRSEASLAQNREFIILRVDGSAPNGGHDPGGAGRGGGRHDEARGSRRGGVGVRRIVGRCACGKERATLADEGKDSAVPVRPVCCCTKLRLAWPQRRSSLLFTLRSTRQSRTKQRERRRLLLGLDSRAHSSRVRRTAPAPSAPFSTGASLSLEQPWPT